MTLNWPRQSWQFLSLRQIYTYALTRQGLEGPWAEHSPGRSHRTNAAKVVVSSSLLNLWNVWPGGFRLRDQWQVLSVYQTRSPPCFFFVFCIFWCCVVLTVLFGCTFVSQVLVSIENGSHTVAVFTQRPATYGGNRTRPRLAIYWRTKGLLSLYFFSYRLCFLLFIYIYHKQTQEVFVSRFNLWENILINLSSSTRKFPQT